LREYNVNDKVIIKINPSIVKGMPHRRFHGKVGVVEKVMRRSLLIDVKVGDKTKKVIARLEHVKPLTA
jgi:large subunit ribosomal protein L21e